MTPDDLHRRIADSQYLIERLLQAERVRFERAGLPERPGLYAISARIADSIEYIRAGRAAGAGGLRQRIYQNHLMGNQAGNLRTQLVTDNVCTDTTHAKAWIRSNCRAQFIVVEDEARRKWGEHFMLATLQPRYSD